MGDLALGASAVTERAVSARGERIWTRVAIGPGSGRGRSRLAPPGHDGGSGRRIGARRHARGLSTTSARACARPHDRKRPLNANKRQPNAE
jgi:hypothetical protein